MSKKRDVKILIDYLSFTVKRDDFIGCDSDDYDFKYMTNRMIKKFYFCDIEFVEKRGFYGYDYSYTYGGITFCHGGRDDIYIQMSGTGCRLWETLNTGVQWHSFIQFLQSTYRVSFSRLDIACDTFNFLSIEKMQKHTIEHRYVSRFRTYFVGIGSDEQSIYFGSAKSDFRIRIYNKTMERLKQVDMENAELVPENWVRIEFQLRDKSAESFIKTWLSNCDISVTYFGIMSNQLNFVKERDINASRSEVTAWWRDFLGNHSKIKMAYQGGLDYNIEKLQRYVFGQAGSSIKTWLEINDYDFVRMESIVTNKQFNQKQLDLLNEKKLKGL